jgi:hypothetical protein
MTSEQFRLICSPKGLMQQRERYEAEQGESSQRVPSAKRAREFAVEVGLEILT